MGLLTAYRIFYMLPFHSGTHGTSVFLIASSEGLSALGSNPVSTRSGIRSHAAWNDSQLSYQLSYRGCLMAIVPEYITSAR